VRAWLLRPPARHESFLGYNYPNETIRKKNGKKKRTEVLLPRELVERIDTLAGERGRTRFFEEALRRELRRRAWEEWLALGKKLKGLTLEDTLYAARAEVEKRGY